MGDPRPLHPDVPQAQLLTETGNGPTLANEEELLAAKFGPPNQAGVYGAPTTAGGGDAG